MSNQSDQIREAFLEHLSEAYLAKTLRVTDPEVLVALAASLTEVMEGITGTTNEHGWKPGLDLYEFAKGLPAVMDLIKQDKKFNAIKELRSSTYFPNEHGAKISVGLIAAKDAVEKIYKDITIEKGLAEGEALLAKKNSINGTWMDKYGKIADTPNQEQIAAIANSPVVVSYLKAGNKPIQAIKEIRLLLKVGLKPAKDFHDYLVHNPTGKIILQEILDTF